MGKRNGTFDVLVLGGSGGPFENSGQSFMLKPHKTHGLESICIDAGSGVGQISHIISSQKLLKSRNQNFIESYYENDFELDEHYLDPTVEAGLGFSDNAWHKLNNLHVNTVEKCYKVYQGIGEYYITHPHLDHTASLIINSPMAYDSHSRSVKQIFGLPFTTNSLRADTFNDRVWPNLTDKSLGRLKITDLKSGEPQRSTVFPEWEIIPFKVSHGDQVSNPSLSVYSTSYIIRDRKSNKAIIIFGDLENDKTKKGPQVFLRKIWQFVVDEIGVKNLQAIFIECSNSSATHDEQLYGHMSPIHVIEEILALKKMSGESIDHLNILIIHVKVISTNRDPRLIVLKELRQLARATNGLERVKFSIALQKYSFVF